MIRKATAEDRDDFSTMWADFLRDAHKEGSDMLPTLHNLHVMVRIFDAYMSGEMSGIVLFAESDGDPIGVMMAGESTPDKVFDSDLGRGATAWGHYVKESHRCQGWAKKLNEEGRRLLAEAGFDVAIGTVLDQNIGSMKTSAKVGAIPICNVMMVRLKGD